MREACSKLSQNMASTRSKSQTSSKIERQGLTDSTKRKTPLSPHTKRSVDIWSTLQRSILRSKGCRGALAGIWTRLPFHCYYVMSGGRQPPILDRTILPGLSGQDAKFDMLERNTYVLCSLCWVYRLRNLPLCCFNRCGIASISGSPKSHFGGRIEAKVLVAEEMFYCNGCIAAAVKPKVCMFLWYQKLPTWRNIIIAQVSFTPRQRKD